MNGHSTQRAIAESPERIPAQIEDVMEVPSSGERPLRILRVAYVDDNRFGGMTRVMHLTTDCMTARGHSVRSIFKGDLPSRIPHQFLRFTLPFRIVQLVLKLHRAGERYDAVEIHEPLAAIYCLARRFDSRLPPVLVFSHSLESRTRLCTLAYRRRKGIRTSLKSRYSPLTLIWQADYALKHGDGVLCSTTEDFDYLRDPMRVPAGKIHFVNWGVLPQYFADPPPEREGIFYHGTWIERKGILDLVPAASQLLTKYPNLLLTLSGIGFPSTVVAGYFPANVRHQLRIIEDRISEQELIDLYLTHSVFVCPSVSEGQLLTMLEASAAGCAVVTTNVCGMKDFIRHGENGLLHEPGDEAALARNLERLIVDPTEARRLGNAAREDARQYTWERAADKLLSAYAAVRDCRPARKS